MSSSALSPKQTLQRYHKAINHLQTIGFQVDASETHGSMQTASATNWACFYALQPNVFTDKKSQAGTTILTAALLCGISLREFLEPSVTCFETHCSHYERRLYQTFVILVGLSACLFLTAVLLCTTELMSLILPYSDMDILENWITKGTVLDALSMTFTYLGFFLLIACMIVAGFFQFDTTLMAFQTIAFVVLSLVTVYLWFSHQTSVNAKQTVRVNEFMQKFCDKSGHLSKKSLHMIMPDKETSLHDEVSAKELSTLLNSIGLSEFHVEQLLDANLTVQDLRVLDDSACFALLQGAGLDSYGHIARVIAAVKTR